MKNSFDSCNNFINQKNLFTGILILMLILSGTFFVAGQQTGNILPYDWKITKENSIPLNDPGLDISHWNDINLGISWERQGYFYASGELQLAAVFTVPPVSISEEDQPFQLAINLQCQIQEVYLNGLKIADGLSFKDSHEILNIPADRLIGTGENILAMRIRNVYYTGGLCRNYIAMSHPSFGENISLNLETDAYQNLFVKNEPITVNLQYDLKDHAGTAIHVKVISDFQHVTEERTIELGHQVEYCRFSL